MSANISTWCHCLLFKEWFHRPKVSGIYIWLRRENEVMLEQTRWGFCSSKGSTGNSEIALASKPWDADTILLVLTIKMSPRDKNHLIENHCTNYLSGPSKNAKVCSLYLRCGNLWNKWNFAILETSFLNTILGTDCPDYIEPILNQTTIWHNHLTKREICQYLAKVEKYCNSKSSYTLEKLSSICTRAHV